MTDLIQKKSHGWIARELYDALWESVMVPYLGYKLILDQKILNNDQVKNEDLCDVEDIDAMEDMESGGRQQDYEDEESAGPAESVKILHMSRKNVIDAVLKNLGPFLVATRESDCRDAEASEDQEEEWYVSAQSDGEGEEEGNNDVDGKETKEKKKNKKEKTLVEVKKAVIFLPPRYHLLLKFHISNTSTVVRLRTDRWQLLAEMDRYLDRWSDQ